MELFAGNLSLLAIGTKNWSYLNWSFKEHILTQTSGPSFPIAVANIYGTVLLRSPKAWNQYQSYHQNITNTRQKTLNNYDNLRIWEIMIDNGDIIGILIIIIHTPIIISKYMFIYPIYPRKYPKIVGKRSTISFYHLVNIQKTMERSTIFHGFLLYPTPRPHGNLGRFDLYWRDSPGRKGPKAAIFCEDDMGTADSVQLEY